MTKWMNEPYSNTYMKASLVALPTGEGRGVQAEPGQPEARDHPRQRPRQGGQLHRRGHRQPHAVQRHTPGWKVKKLISEII